MATGAKIRISDDVALRATLKDVYTGSSQVQLCQFALMLARHVLELARYDDPSNPIIQEGYAANEKWQNGAARMHDVRQAGFRIHQLAKASEDIVEQTALRAVGQAVSTGHMREHAMVASDYAIKVVNLLYPNDMEAVKQERLWQIQQLQEINASI